MDPKKTNRIKVADLLCSEPLAELLELQEENLPEDYEQSNWFSIHSVERVHGIYRSLDADKNGLLSPEELSRFNGGSLSRQCIERVYQVCQSYGGEIDYRVFLEFVLAKENPRTEESITFFFKLLNIKEDGYLTTVILHHFWRGIEVIFTLMLLKNHYHFLTQ